MKKSKSIFFIILLIVSALSYTAIYSAKIPFGAKTLIIKGADRMRFGIDIRGGIEAVYGPKDLDRAPTREEMDAARAVVESRLDSKNIYDREVTVDYTNNNILVRFPWKSDETDFNPQQSISELGETAHLTFKDPEGNVVVDGKNIKKSYYALEQQEGPVVHLEFDDEGAAKFSEATGRLINQQISIYMDDTLISSPTVQTQITEGTAFINGMESAAAAKELADKISSGALPFSLESKNHSIISPSLGSGALDVMVMAGTVAFILVCLFMLIYYKLPGFVACIALALQASGQLLALSLPQFTLTLPGIAAVILSIGMGVDANIIISERIKEELKLGKPLNSAISSGFNKAFSSVFDGNITVIIVALVLMRFGSGSMLSFAYSLLTGVILNFIAGVTASRLMIRSLSNYSFLRKPTFFGARSVKS